MGMIATQSEEALGLKGLHLYFASQSNCSSRVRLQLAEKHLGWIGHHFNLLKKETIDPAYFAINPRGLVPSLVHDGRVIVESGDIMLYLEKQFPKPSFTPEEPADRSAMQDWVLRAQHQHVAAVKTYAYIKMNARLAAKTPQEVKLYYELQKDREMLDFHSKHDLPGHRFSAEDEQLAVRTIESTLAQMKERIEATGWLAGPSYSLADMAWATSWLTWQRAQYPLEKHVVVRNWFERIEARPAWKAVAQLWSHPPESRILQMGPSGEPIG